MGYAFISYSSKQQQEADGLRLRLQQSGIDTWMAPYDIPEGNRYADVIDQAIQQAACVVLLLTQDSQQSVYVDKEIERALHYKKTIAPVQLEQTVLNDSFTFYLCNQQIVPIPSVDEESPQLTMLLRDLSLLCGGQASGGLSQGKQRPGRIPLLLGIGGVLLALLASGKYEETIGHSLHLELYDGAVPTLPELIRTFGLIYLCAFLAAVLAIYGAARMLRGRKKGCSPFRIVSASQWLLMLSALLGAASRTLSRVYWSVGRIEDGLGHYSEEYSYELPYRVTATADRLKTAAICILAGALLLWLLRGGYKSVKKYLTAALRKGRRLR